MWHVSATLYPANFPQQLCRHCCHGFTAATTAEGRCQNKPLTVFIQFRNCYMAGRQTAVGYLSFRQGCSHGLYTFGFTEGTALQLPLGTFRSLRALLGPKSLSDSLSVTGPETPIGHISFRWGTAWPTDCTLCSSLLATGPETAFGLFVPLRASRAQGVYLLRVLKLSLGTFRSAADKAGPTDSTLFVPLIWWSAIEW